MSIETLAGLPQFLRVLATYPAPDDVMAALATGPMGGYGGVAARFWLFDGPDLVHGGGYGYTDDEVDRYSILTPEVPFAMWDAVRAGEFVVTTAESTRATPLDVVDREFRQAMLTRSHTASVVRTPLMIEGEAVGAMGMAMSRPWPGDEAAMALVRALASAVALWATTPESEATGVVEATRARARSVELAFSARELEILRLVEDRMPTGAIARALLVSESTVKRELREAMRALDTSDRVEAAARARALGLLD